jgi:5-formyltetrahydrofolate cyclo-ligase
MIHEDYIELEKRKVRHEFLTLRNGINQALSVLHSASIFFRIKRLSIYKKSKIVMFYLSCGSEVITDFMINSAIGVGKTITVPAVEKSIAGKMHAMKIFKLENACQTVYGVRQPEIKPDNIIEKNSIDLIFVPGLAFDVFGYRIGYGKGYYDRWLENVSLEKIVGLAYDFQIINRLPIKKQDLPVGIIVTEKRIIQVTENQGAER